MPSRRLARRYTSGLDPKVDERRSLSWRVRTLPSCHPGVLPDAKPQAWIQKLTNEGRCPGVSALCRHAIPAFGQTLNLRPGSQS
eukprot:11866574-Prorocentrum_lima.AAC.1